MLPFLLEAALRSLVLAATVGMVLTALRIRTPRVSSWAWSAVLLTSLTMPLLMLVVKSLMTISNTPAWLPIASPTIFLRPLPASAAVPAQSSTDWWSVALGVYLTIALLLLLRLASGFWRSRRAVRTAALLTDPWTVGFDVRVSEEIQAPGTVGSTILLPADWTDWSAFKREAVMLHEQQHVRARHFSILLLAGIHRAIFWFNPLSWWLQNKLTELAETACDEAALRVLDDRISYAEILIDLAEKSSSPHAAGIAMARGNTVTGRVERILQQTSLAPETSMIRRIVLIALFLPLVGIATSTWITEATVLAPAARAAKARIVRVVQPAESPQAPVAPPAPQPQPPQAVRTEVTNYLSKWPDQEVPDIISPDERAVFEKLRTDEEREMFIQQFWLRRDPTPETEANEYRENYYRRIVQANERFTTGGTPGWKTDRGRIYILHGPPDEVETHAQGSTYLQLGGGPRSTFPFERWRYRNIAGMGQNMILEFVDTAKDGTYKLQFDPYEKGRIFIAPNARQ
jgi:GWxTD domain-containing protein